MFEKYGIHWVNREEYKDWLCNDIILIINNTEYIYRIKHNTRLAIRLACEFGGYGRSQLTKKDIQYIKNNL